MSWSQGAHHNSPDPKQITVVRQEKYTYEYTIIKNQDKQIPHDKYDQTKTPNVTHQPIRKGLIFVGNNRSKHLFPLYRDAQIGIVGELQKKVHHSTHDDDRMTTTTQLGLAISQTCQDLYEVLYPSSDQSQPHSYTQKDPSPYSRFE